jgi:hypothetical protein
MAILPSQKSPSETPYNAPSKQDRLHFPPTYKERKYVARIFETKERENTLPKKKIADRGYTTPSKRPQRNRRNEIIALDFGW